MAMIDQVQKMMIVFFNRDEEEPSSSSSKNKGDGKNLHFSIDQSQPLPTVPSPFRAECVTMGSIHLTDEDAEEDRKNASASETQEESQDEEMGVLKSMESETKVEETTSKQDERQEEEPTNNEESKTRNETEERQGANTRPKDKKRANQSKSDTKRPAPPIHTIEFKGLSSGSPRQDATHRLRQ
jgi:hypothetical protein